MVQFNVLAKEIVLKIVYCGPALSGKTANLQALHAMCLDDFQGEFFSINTQEDRTLFFDLLPIDLGGIYSNSIHLKVYTVPGQPQYDATRRIVLDSADGVVFVVDSSEAKIQENIDSFSNLQQNLSANGLDIKHIPLVIQYNKRDLADATPVGVLNRKLNFRAAPYFESVAVGGVGVADTFVSIVLGSLASVFQKHKLDQSIQDYHSVAEKVEASLRGALSPAQASRPASLIEKTTIVRHENTSVQNLPEGRQMDPDELLADAINSSMETARLYASQKRATEEIEKQLADLAAAKASLEKTNEDNLKVRAFLEALLHSLGEAIISFSSDGRILTWNAAAEDVFGEPRSAAFGNDIAQLVPSAAHEAIMDAAQKIFQGAAEQATTCKLLHPDGQVFDVSIVLYPVAGNAGQPIAVSAIAKRKA